MFLNCKYYIDEDFTTEFSNIDYHFSILHFNSRSLNIHFNALSYFICTLCIDFSETWINDSTPPLSISQKKTRLRVFARTGILQHRIAEFSVSSYLAYFSKHFDNLFTF